MTEGWLPARIAPWEKLPLWCQVEFSRWSRKQYQKDVGKLVWVHPTGTVCSCGAIAYRLRPEGEEQLSGYEGHHYVCEHQICQTDA